MREGYREYEESIQAAPESEPEVKVVPEDIWILIYTSGTAGKPKVGVRSRESHKDSRIIIGGEHVYPSEVEEIIGGHKSVFDVAIVGLPHERWGEGVTAFVIPQDPDNPPTEEEIIDFCRGKMAGYKRPQAVYFISQEEMPRTGSGKVLHRALRERYACD